MNRQTKLVIEGFPRSANSFALAAFTLAQASPTATAYHIHASAQVIRAARYGIPALVVIRKPEDAVLSDVIKTPYITLKQSLRDYVRFYTRIRTQHGKYVVGAFEEVTSDFGMVINRINRRFGTRFSPFDHSKENVETCFAIIESMDLRESKSDAVTESRVARPSVERFVDKDRLRRQLEAEDLQELLAAANTLYDQLTQDEI